MIAFDPAPFGSACAPEESTGELIKSQRRERPAPTSWKRDTNGVGRSCSSTAFHSLRSWKECTSCLDTTFRSPVWSAGDVSRPSIMTTCCPRIRKPALITHGACDAIVKPAIVELHKAAMRHAQIQLVPNMGHGVFWDDAGLLSISNCTHLARVCRP
jgi:pimeloyl-ACP methyl ester carboxylesterase